MQQSSGNFEGARGLTIFQQSWRPDTTPRAVVLIAHGAAEHSGRYLRLAEFLTGHDYAVAALDHPGHGLSEGDRCYVESFDDYLQTLRIFHQRISTEYSELPIFLLGHSMGGLISAAYLLRYQQDLAGCILSGPAIVTDVEPGKLQMLLIRLLSVLLPHSGVLQLDASGVSRDPAEVERYLNDPLVYTGKLPARWVRELFPVMHEVQDRAGEIALPVLIAHGGEDALASPAGSEFLYREVSSSDKTLRIYPGLYHEIFNEPEHEQVFADVLAWLDKRLDAA